MEDIESRVKSIILEELDVDPARVTENASLRDDLGADDLAMVELVMKLEEEFGIKIQEDVAEKMVTVRDAIGYVRQHAG